MNPLDWLLTIVLLYSAGRAAARGLVREAFALTGLLVGFVLACWYYGALARVLAGLLSSPSVAQFAAFLLILAAVMIAATLLGSVVHRTAKVVGLGFLNRLFGAVFGLLRGAALCGAFLLALTAFLPASPWVAQSQLAPSLLRAAHAVSFVMPSELSTRLAAARTRLKHTAPGWIKSAQPSHTSFSAKQLKNPDRPRIAASETRT